MKKREKRYRVTIEGDEAAMRQIASAFELQGRIHLGQFDEVGKVLEHTVSLVAQRDGPPISVSGLTENDEAKARSRWESLMVFRDKLSPHWNAAENIWRGTFSGQGPLQALSPHRSREQTRAYTLWKWMEHYLLHLNLTEENRSLLRETVHYAPPMLAVPDLKVLFEVVPDQE